MSNIGKTIQFKCKGSGESSILTSFIACEYKHPFPWVHYVLYCASRKNPEIWYWSQKHRSFSYMCTGSTLVCKSSLSPTVMIWAMPEQPPCLYTRYVKQPCRYGKTGLSFSTSKEKFNKILKNSVWHLHNYYLLLPFAQVQCLKVNNAAIF